MVWMQCYFSQQGLKPLNTAGATAEGSFTNIVMSGQDVFRFAVRAVPAVSLLLLHWHAAAPFDTTGSAFMNMSQKQYFENSCLQ